MPTKLKTRCRFPGCGRAATERFCPEHRAESYRRPADRHRGTPAQRGYDHRWRKVRHWYLRREPLCEDCLDEGIVNAEHLEVDHIIPIAVRPDLRLNVDNLRTLCRQHHKRKTDADKRRYGIGQAISA